MKLHFELHAQQEFEDAVAYYDGVTPRLGNAFIEEVERVISQILSFPTACPQLSPSTRRCRIKRFPYGLLYRLREDEVEIIAVMHFSREPNYWVDRL